MAVNLTWFLSRKKLCKSRVNRAEKTQEILIFAANSTFSSDACRKSTLPAFCHFVFTPCHIGKKGDIKRGNRLCREDCQLLKHDVCHKEFIERNENSFLEVSSPFYLGTSAFFLITSVDKLVDYYHKYAAHCLVIKTK